MFGSHRRSDPQKPPDPTSDPPPTPDDRYAPTSVIRLDMVDVEGKPVCVLLTRRACAMLADELFSRLVVAPVEGGAE